MIVLFVCTGNTCRSPMAEGILKSIAKEKKLSLEVKSAGISVFDGDNASRNSIEAMKKIGIDISKHKARQLHRDLVDEADLILTMSKPHKEIIISNFPSAKDKIFALLEYVYKIDKDIADPYGGNLLLYEHTREEIYKAIKKIIDNGQLTIN
ncbi:low molecular weight protein arginine phosphatase [uncultured Tissierella sp.]|jgi:protein-tyrosine-phosphatase|uniref:low molecular weight protein arginine phosphatase n=1 Tax=uncultured Tissierella sp. TaxID=448160 RepID=UPI002805EEB7|nr:low molecular weight protein arginine phosphatase [uncultured Tissierella sp.]MDU5079812.1 low molecular weight protein arginine phosphatase [Bacillota bacterium]